MDNGYVAFCRRIAAGMLADKLDPLAESGRDEFCMRLRLFGGSTELKRFETRGGEIVELEVWRGSTTPVPEWFDGTKPS